MNSGNCKENSRIRQNKRTWAVQVTRFILMLLTAINEALTKGIVRLKKFQKLLVEDMDSLLKNLHREWLKAVYDELKKDKPNKSFYSWY